MKRLILCVAFASGILGCSQAPEAPTETSAQALAAGLQVYTANCASCHQTDGYGVPNMQPALVDDPVVAGDPTVLMRVILNGPASVLPANRPAYSNVMPPFSRLTDQQIADVLTYIRHDYGHQASAIDVGQVRVARAQFGP